MNRRLRPRPLVVVALSALLPVACDYSGKQKVAPANVRTAPLPSVAFRPGQGKVSQPQAKAATILSDSPEQKEKREAILNNVIQLIRSASIKPGGDNFLIATKNLNQYFEQGTKPEDFAMADATRSMLLAEGLPEAMVKEFASPAFDPRYDGRHIEDCMLYHELANRVAGEGDDLTRVRRMFDWMVRQVQLVPQQSLAPTGMEQAQARPFDVLLRGMATEAQGYWTERGWVFMALCRQLGVDAGIVTYAPRLRSKLSLQPSQPADTQPIAWICVALIGEKAYLFDQRLGIAVPDARGDGVATLEEALADPQILARLDLPGQISYEPTRADLLASPTKIGVLIDSSRGYFSPKMRLLQSRLTGKNRTILFKDPVEQRAHFAKVLGPRLGEVKLWLIPLQVETLLFTNPKFVEATQAALRLFDGRLPLLYARMAQLKGDLDEAIRQYVAFRFATNGVMRDKPKTPIVPALQRELDVYATHFLALCNLEKGKEPEAEFFFKQLLKNTPLPQPDREYCFMFRWGAITNLGLLAMARGDVTTATSYLTQFVPPPQIHGNLWLAREMVWRDPTAPIAAPLPPAPPRTDPGKAVADAR